MKLKSEFAVKQSFRDFSLEFRSYLSPRLREIFDSSLILEKKLKSSYELLDHGLLPPLSVRNEIKVLVERIIDGISAIAERENVKAINDELKKVRKAGSLVEETMLKLTPTSKSDVTKYGEYLGSISKFIFSFVLPIFSELAKEMAINPDKFWDFLHRKFVEKAKERIGKRPKVSNEEEEND